VLEAQPHHWANQPTQGTQHITQKKLKENQNQSKDNDFNFKSSKTSTGMSSGTMLNLVEKCATM
jgi:hypothetical protein